MKVDHLTDSARWAVEEVVAMLAAGWTGDIVIECREGGVRELRDGRRRQPPKEYVPKGDA